MDRKKILVVSAISSGVQKSENGSSANGRNTDGSNIHEDWTLVERNKTRAFQRFGITKVAWRLEPRAPQKLRKSH